MSKYHIALALNLMIFSCISVAGFQVIDADVQTDQAGPVRGSPGRPTPPSQGLSPKPKPGDPNQATTGRPAPEAVTVQRQNPLPTLSKPNPVRVRPTQTFLVNPGESLRQVLGRWTQASGWSLVWEPANDYTLSAGAAFHGDLKESLRSLMESLRAGGAPYGVELWAANRIVRVVAAR